MAILGLASFLQPQVSGQSVWPSGNDGQTWNLIAGSGGSYAIAGADHQISGSSTIYGDHGTLTGATNTQILYYGSSTAGDFELLMRVSITSSVNTAPALIGRGNSAGTQFYRARLKNGNLDVQAVTPTSTTTLGTAPFSLTLGKWYYLRFRVTGSTLQAKAWPDDGSGEPGSWTVAPFTDTTITGTGRFGISCLLNSSGEVVSFSSFSATDGTTPSSVVNDGPYGFTYYENGSMPGNTPVPVNPPSGLFSDLASFANGAPTTPWLRYQHRWRILEDNPTSGVADPPVNTSVYDATSLAVLDYVVAQCNANNINLLLTLQDCPNNYQVWNDSGAYVANDSNNQATGLLPAPSGMVRYARFIADRYNGFTGHGKVQALQIGNEEWDASNTNRTGLSMAPVVNLTFPAIQAIYPGVQTGFCAVRKTPNNASGHITAWCNTVFAALTCKPHYCDFHYYRDGTCSPDPTVPCTDSSHVPTAAQEMALIAASAAANGQAGIFITCQETGQQLGANVNGITVTELLRSQYLRAVYDAGRQAANNQVKRVLIWTIDYGTSTSSITSSTQPTWGDLQAYAALYPQWSGGSGVSAPPLLGPQVIFRGRDGKATFVGR